eukprot:CAMPEP_0197620088 /NCGR_PEP_ID=MMETSP1338-20131121/965_1 /TAXON_ID=43686 ORGANISM="Pelagodinium beii, Strain RCC1491" /NCGR_SAMPLE_ID=MMETSP1338 /ASSEMBLY_ACC=CAM_ASM_000754 /LENGTH=711 /DNA_ID=CAMNT_0043189165 /DNA_START=54 /DNA_END=2189 /DNA_ORIENTATION=+
MQSCLIQTLALATLAALAVQGAKIEGSSAAGHPVKDVVVLLRKEKLSVDQEGQQEQRTYNKFKGWCDRSISTLAEDIESNRALLSKTKNAAFGKEKDIEELDKAMDRLQKEMDRLQASIESANSERADAKSAFDEAAKDMQDTIDALEEAKKGLDASAKDATETNDKEVASGAAAVLLRKPAVLSLLSESPKAEKLEAMLEVGQPKPIKKVNKEMMKTRDYEFKSGDIVNLLMELKEDFTMKLREAKKEEADAVTKHGYLVEDLNKAKAAADGEKKQKDENKADANSKLTDLKTTMDDAAKKKEADEKTKTDTEVSCKTKADEWTERKAIRYDELQAIKKAMDILSEVSGVQTEVPKNEKLKKASLITQSSEQSDDPKSVVVEMLRERAHQGRADAAALERMAEEVEETVEVASESSDPKWKKDLIKSINKQVYTLKDEQKADDEHFNWCSAELSEANASHNEKTALFMELNASILEKEGKIKTLQTAITKAQKKVANLTAEMEERTRIREENKEENEAAIHDAKIAQVAIAKAISVLSTFYEDATAAAALVQTKIDDKPATWEDGSSYTGSSKKAGVVGILEEIEKDMAKMETDTVSQESEDQNEYDQAMHDAKKDKATAKTEIELKTEERNRKEDEMRRKIKTKKITDRELATVKRYLDELTETCDKEDYKVRKASRTDQISDLEGARTMIQEVAVVDESSFLSLRGSK